MRWTVVIPVKGTSDAKSRLGAPAPLARAIALDSVAAVAGIGSVARSARAEEVALRSLIVVTPSAAAGDFLALGARVVDDPGEGLNAAIAAGISVAGAGPVAVLLGDVPALQPAELAAALSAAERHPLAMVPDADGSGTVLVTALDASDHAPAFGPGSRALHHAAGYAEIEVGADSGLRRDVDTPAQLAALGERVGPRTRAILFPPRD